MKKRFRAHYARHQPFYEIVVIGGFWITLLIAALLVEAYLE